MTQKNAQTEMTQKNAQEDYDVAQALKALRTDVNTLSKARGKWRRRSMAAFVVAIVSVGAAAAAMVTTTNNFSAMKGDLYVYDESTLVVVSNGMFAQDVALTAAGTTSGAAVESTIGLDAANTAIAAGDWFYEVVVKEAGNATLGSGTLQIELFQDGVSKGALFMAQATADAAAIEGVTARWSLSSSLEANAAYVVKVTQA